MFSLYTGEALDSEAQIRRWKASVSHKELKPLSAPHGRSWLALDFCSSSSHGAETVLVTESHVYCFDGSVDYRSELVCRLGRAANEVISDVKLFAQAFGRWGENCLENIFGDFAGAVWDRKRRVLWAFTDHCARVKLYWSQVPSGFVVSTYLPTMLATTGCKPTLDGIALASTAVALAVRPGHTAFQHVKFVLSGHALQWRPGQSPCLRPWYALPENRPASRRVSEEQRREFVCAFREAVNTRIPSRGSVAGTLSGGLDSTLVVGHAADLLANAKRPLYAYTAVPHPGLTSQCRQRWDTSDWSYASSVAMRHSNVVHAAVHAGGVSMIEQFRRQHDLLASPVRNGANHQWMLAIANAARERQAKVLLIGQRGNQTISRSRGDELLSIAFCAGDIGALRDLVMLRAEAGPRALLAAVGRALIAKKARAHERRSYLAQHLAKYTLNDRSGVRRAFQTATHDVAQDGWTYGQCHMLQRAMCFATDLRVTHGVTMRDPTTDRRMLEVLFRLPPVSGSWRGLDRGVARWAGEGVVPDDIRSRTTRGEQVPEEADLPSLYRDEYEATWASIRTGQIGEVFFIDDLDLRFRAVMAGGACRTDAAFVHRVLDIGLFMQYVESTWGRVELDWGESAAAGSSCSVSF